MVKLLVFVLNIHGDSECNAAWSYFMGEFHTDRKQTVEIYWSSQRKNQTKLWKQYKPKHGMKTSLLASNAKQSWLPMLGSAMSISF